MSIIEQVKQTAAAIRERTSIVPSVGIVLGSGLGAFAEKVQDAITIPYGELPDFPTSSVTGHKGELVVGKIGDVNVAIMSGRVHFYEGYSLERVTFPVRVLKELGADKLIVTNAAGAANPYYRPGDFMVIVDHLNLTGTNPLIGPNEEKFGPRFPDMSEAYCMAGRDALHRSAAQVGVTLHAGIYAGLSGPSYETPAEIRMLQVIGADAVGMSTVNEVIVANHCGMTVAGLSVITNRAAGLSAEKLSHDEVKEIAAKVENVLCDLLAATVGHFK